MSVVCLGKAYPCTLNTQKQHRQIWANQAVSLGLKTLELTFNIALFVCTVLDMNALRLDSLELQGIAHGTYRLPLSSR